VVGNRRNNNRTLYEAHHQGLTNRKFASFATDFRGYSSICRKSGRVSQQREMKNKKKYGGDIKAQ
jgi:hypothetical protein